MRKPSPARSCLFFVLKGRSIFVLHCLHLHSKQARCSREGGREEKRVERAQKKKERSNEARSNTIHRGRMKRRRGGDDGDSDLICTNAAPGTQVLSQPLLLRATSRSVLCPGRLSVSLRRRGRKEKGKPHATEITLCKPRAQNLARLAVAVAGMAAGDFQN